MRSATATATPRPRRDTRPKGLVAASRPVGPPDFFLSLSVILLVSLGLVLVYSSSAAFGARNFGDSAFFIEQQLGHCGLGILALFVLSRAPRAWLAQNAVIILAAAVILCCLVLVPGLGVFRGGARRWLEVGPVGFQPSEVAKLAVVVVMAAILARRERRPAKERKSLLVPVLVAQIPIVLVLGEPDLGTALVMELIVGAMVFVGGVRLRTLILLGLATLPVFYHLVVGTPFRLRRLLGFIDPWAYRSTVGYQVTEALISIGSGGATGLGLGEGRHGLFFLPEAHTDFIFAILAQELGFAGVALLLLAYGVLLFRAVRLALKTSDAFDRYLAIGVMALVGVPAVFNTCVATGLLPTKGLPLPMVSYGGSNLVMTLAAIGLLFRIDRDLRRQRQKEPSA